MVHDKHANISWFFYSQSKYFQEMLNLWVPMHVVLSLCLSLSFNKTGKIRDFRFDLFEMFNLDSLEELGRFLCTGRNHER